jgi:hypothetical protein
LRLAHQSDPLLRAELRPCSEIAVQSFETSRLAAHFPIQKYWKVDLTYENQFTFAPALGPEMPRDIRWVLVLFLQLARTNMAARGRKSPNKRTTDGRPPENNVYRCVESTWIPGDQGCAQRMQVDKSIRYW